MSASIAATSSEGGASTLGEPGKRRRVRKRQSRQQLGGAGDNESSSSSSDEQAPTDPQQQKATNIDRASREQEGEETKGARKRKRTRSKKNKEMSAPGPGGEVGLASPAASLADTGGGQSDEVKADEAGTNGKEKRKRKRTRGKGRKEDEIEQAAGESAPHAPVQPTASMQAYLDSIGLPQDKSGLSEKTVNALAYARQFLVDRAGWKFNKARQEYLIRHMLAAPPALTSEPGQQGKEPTNTDEVAIDAETGTKEQPQDQHWPDEWNRCVAQYLLTVQGKAKERLLDTLTRAARQEIPPIVEDEAGVADTGAAEAAPAPAAETTSKSTMSVSFGDLAMRHDAAGVLNGDQASTAKSAQEVHKIRFEKERAEKLLREMQD